MEFCHDGTSTSFTTQALLPQRESREGERCQLVNLPESGHGFVMIFLRLARSFRLFRGCVCLAFSGPGVRSGVLRTGGILFDGLLSILFLLISCGSQIL